MGQARRDFGIVVASEVLETVVEALFAVVGDVYHHSLALLEAAHYGINYGVVVEHGIVVVRQYVALPLREVGAVVVVGVEVALLARIA